MKNLPLGLAFKYAECSDFTFLFCRERLINIQSFIMHVQSHCSAHNFLFLYHVLVVVAVKTPRMQIDHNDANLFNVSCHYIDPLILFNYHLNCHQVTKEGNQSSF